MNRNLVLGLAGVVLVVAALGIAFATGLGPAPGGPDAGGEDAGEFPTATPSGGDGGGSDGNGGDGGDVSPAGDGDRAPLEPQFVFQVERIEQCGTTCRNVTGTLRNRGDAAAENVTVYSRLFVGNGTDESDRVWQGSEEVGRLAAGDGHESTRRIELTFREALRVRQSGGWVTVQTTVQTANRTVTFSERRKVA
jgi:hypothetical protein